MRIEQETDQSNKKLNYVFGVVEKPSSRGQKFIFGWDEIGNPSLFLTAREDQAITRQGYNTRGANAVVEFPLDPEYATYAPKIFEFMGMAKPIDNADRGSQFTEDVVNIACANGIGSTSFLAVKELTLLDSIIKGQISWDINGIPSYSIVIPDENTETLNFILFSPGTNPSNELSYRTFLLSVIKVLAKIDREQVPPDQKGYMDVVRDAVGVLEAKAARERAVSPLNKIRMDLGLLNEVGGVERLMFLGVDDLCLVLQNYQIVAEESFAAGRNS
jgi:hypothetical protein